MSAVAAEGDPQPGAGAASPLASPRGSGSDGSDDSAQDEDVITCDTCDERAAFLFTARDELACGTCGEPWTAMLDEPMAMCGWKCPHSIWEVTPSKPPVDGRRRRESTYVTIEDECGGCGSRLDFDIAVWVERLRGGRRRPEELAAEAARERREQKQRERERKQSEREAA